MNPIKTKTDALRRVLGAQTAISEQRDHMRELSDSIAGLWPQSEADVKMSEALVRLDDVVQVLEEVLCAVASVRR